MKSLKRMFLVLFAVPSIVSTPFASPGPTRSWPTVRLDWEKQRAILLLTCEQLDTLKLLQVQTLHQLTTIRAQMRFDPEERQRLTWGARVEFEFGIEKVLSQDQLRRFDSEGGVDVLIGRPNAFSAREKLNLTPGQKTEIRALVSKTADELGSLRRREPRTELRGDHVLALMRKRIRDAQEILTEKQRDNLHEKQRTANDLPISKQSIEQRLGF